MQFIKYSVLSAILIFFNIQLCCAGPPFDTDDPETVLFKHWEYYISSINIFQPGARSGTSPHFEVNYGLAPNLQVHLLMPLNYYHSNHQGVDFGYADTEFGLKYRFINETENAPQAGIFPIIEIPTVKNSEFSDGKVKIFLPLWLQKSWGKLTTYGGIGYWINPGTDNKNWIFSGWEIQYSFSPVITLGGELYYHSTNTKNGKSGTGFNLGGSINATEKFHIIFSLGHSLTNDKTLSSYFGFLWTI